MPVTEKPSERFRDPSPPVAELVRRAQSGSMPGFVELVRRFEGRLFNFLLRRSRTIEDAEDLTQETFVRAWQRLDQYNPRWQFSTWLFTIGHRLAAAQGRRRRPVATAHPPEQAAAADDPARVAADREQYGLIWDLADRVLTDTQRSALWLRYAEDLPIRHIARIMGKSSVSIRVTLCRARERLARHEHAAGSTPIEARLAGDLT